MLLRDFPSREALLQSIWASCHIPASFHPLEFFTLTKPKELKSRVLYPFEEGMELDFLDSSWVDGGLSANIPYVPDHHNLRVSVLAGPPSASLITRGEGGLRLPGYVYMSGLKVYLSLTNLHAGAAAMGASEAAMTYYYDLGIRDGQQWVEERDTGDEQVGKG